MGKTTNKLKQIHYIYNAIVVSGFHFLVWLEKKSVIDLFGLFLYIYIKKY